MTLIIVESPTKAKTISQFLPQFEKELKESFQIESSNGHLRDLPKGEMGIDIEGDFEPRFVVPTKSRKRATFLRKQAQEVKKVILATDEDREGEAIAWHILEIIRKEALRIPKYKRVVFHEITREAVLDALKNPRRINLKLVDAQKARRILDRLVGYELSPFIWKKFFRGLSAGRVQSVALRLIVDREREIEKFIPQEYWTIQGEFSSLINQSSKKFTAKLIKINDETLDKLAIKNKKEADEIIKDLETKRYQIEKISKKEIKKNPPTPFITSTLQQEASKSFGFSVKKTMFLAQQLYEGIKLGKQGFKGLITYTRTDSFNLSEKFLTETKKFIEEKYGREYSLETFRIFKKKTKLAQEAHEAIRPTKIQRTPEEIKKFLEKDLFKLYDLIWKRSLACQMKEALFDLTTIDIISQQRSSCSVSGKANQQYLFRASESILRFDGFLKIWRNEAAGNICSQLPSLSEKEELKLIKVLSEQHFTEPPPRYTDASLVKTLEEYGIGRPSTYAPIISLIQERGYVEKKEKKFFPKEIGFLVNDLLAENFPKIIDIKFTAKMEEDLDRIARGRIGWRGIVKKFYFPFKEELDQKEKKIEKVEEKTDKLCQKCGKPMIIKYGRFGKFIACSNFPECKNTQPFENFRKEKQEKIFCDKCGGEMVIRPGRFGYFWGCSKYPDCKNIKSINKSLEIGCPKCQKGEIIERKTRKGRTFYGCDQYPECDFALWQKPINQLCPKCRSLMIEEKDDGEIVCSNKECQSYKS